tara:strand:- start:200 stop:955 length:756 start_codon:yes stop_codon:yes gene_type:complete
MRILLLGGTGYVGKAIKNELNDMGLSVFDVGTRTYPNFKIGEIIDENIFKNIDYVLYLSWYFDTRDKKYSQKNIESFQRVNDICKKNKIKLFFISTLLASNDSKSKYNKTKAACEEIALKSGFPVLRLGTVLLEGYKLTGTYEKVVNFVSKYKIYPRIYPNKAIYQKTNINNLKEICSSLESLENKIYTFTKPENLVLEDILNLKNKYFISIPLHWSMVYIPLKIFEVLKIPTRIKSDMVKSIWLSENNGK